MPKRNLTGKSDNPEKFELLDLLGIGGFAQTYKARVMDQNLIEEFGENVVALKIPLPDKARVLKRDLEMNTLLHLRLRGIKAINIVRYLGFDLYDGKIVLAFEYIEDGSLRDKIGEIGSQVPLEITDAIQIAMKILEGLSLIHKEHIFHRDIKPENILLQDGYPKIADLGLSRMMENNECSSSSLGTIDYMSPEILGTEGASFTSDIWSLGVTLYEMVTGRLPFGDSNTPIGDLVDLIRNSKQSAACDVYPNVPQRFSDIIERALCKKPSDRFSGADEMLEALKSLCDTEDDRLEREMDPIRELIDRFENTEDIENNLKGIVKRFNNNAKAFQHIGEYYNRCQRFEDAIRNLKKGIRIEKNNATLRWDIALAYQGLKKKNLAIQNLKKAIALDLNPSVLRHAEILLNILRGND